MLRETQSKLSQAATEHFKLQSEHERLVGDLNQAIAKNTELRSLIGAK